ncbi:MAG TPA: hypothetical protein PKD26_07500 [Pyrinomonadaceae bacterium]|nr:hypothetical protein [Pyrinomonadaceae bacterium]
MADRGNFQAPAELNRLRTAALGAGGIALIIWAIGLYFDPEQALLSWLLGFIFWGGICIGGIGMLILQYLTGGAWGVVIRRIVEAASRTLPVVFIMFIPLAVGVATHTAYEFTHLPADDYTVIHRGWFMTSESWILRSAAYFVLFGVMVYLLNKWGAEQDKTTNYEDAERFLGRATAFSGPTMVFYALTVTFAVVDWVMILDPHWFSTMWGLLFVAGWALSCLCFTVAVLAWLSVRAPMDRVVGRRHFHDLGKLMLALVMVWAYFNFSQFLIIWSGNIPEETGWYITRMTGAWGVIGVVLVLLHFAVPYLLLLRQDLKRKAKVLASIAVFILLMRIVDMFYLIAPNPRINMHGLEKGAFILSWMDFVAPIAVGGIWLWYFFGQLMKRPLVPVMDPFLEKAIEHGHGH